jgi:hypothetical protein
LQYLAPLVRAILGHGSFVFTHNYLLRDRFAGTETDTLDDVKKGEGKIVRLHGRKFAA